MQTELKRLQDRFRKVTLGVLFALSAILVNAQQPRLPVEFVDGGTTLTLVAGKDARVVILNNTRQPQQITVTVIDDVSQGGPGLGAITELDPIKVEVPAAGSSTIVLKLKSADTVKAGSVLSGFLVVSALNSNDVIRRALVFRAPEPKLTSLVSSITSTVYYNPWRDPRVEPLEAALPLTSPLKTQAVDEAFEKNKTVARLAAANGESAAVVYQGAKENLPAGTTGIVLGFKNEGRPGSFTGNLASLQTEDKKPVTLTVISKHHWIFPALAIALGLLLYYLMQRYLNVVRKIWGLLEREANVEHSFAEADKAFAKDAEGQTYTRYQLKTNFEKQRAALQTTINRLKYQAFLRLDEGSKDYKAIEERIAELEVASKDWSEFGKKLNLLQASLDSLRPSFATVPVELSLDKITEPVIATNAASALSGDANLTLTGAKKLIARVVDIQPRLQAWSEYHSRAETVRHGLNEIIKSPVFSSQSLEYQEAVRKAEVRAFTTWHRLWVDGNFDIQKVHDQISRAEAALDHAQSTAARSRATEPVMMSPDGNFGGEAPTDRIRHIVHKRLGTDLFYLALAFVIALYSGLVVNYFKVPFGTVRDYIDVFVWGFSTKAVVDLVTAGIGRLWPTPSN